MESGGEAIPCKETIRIFLNFPAPRTVAGWLCEAGALFPKKALAGASLCRGLRWFRGDFGCHSSKLRGWVG